MDADPLPQQVKKTSSFPCSIGGESLLQLWLWIGLLSTRRATKKRKLPHEMIVYRSHPVRSRRRHMENDEYHVPTKGEGGLLVNHGGSHLSGHFFAPNKFAPVLSAGFPLHPGTARPDVASRCIFTSSHDPVRVLLYSKGCYSSMAQRNLQY